MHRIAYQPRAPAFSFWQPEAKVPPKDVNFFQRRVPRESFSSAESDARFAPCTSQEDALSFLGSTVPVRAKTRAGALLGYVALPQVAVRLVPSSIPLALHRILPPPCGSSLKRLPPAPTSAFVAERSGKKEIQCLNVSMPGGFCQMLSCCSLRRSFASRTSSPAATTSSRSRRAPGSAYR